MPCPKKQLILFLIISFSAVSISIKSAKAAEKSERPAEAKPAEAKPAGSSAGVEKVEYKAEDFRDPFQEEKIEAPEEPLPEEAKPLPELQVQGFVWGGSNPQAIINNKVLTIGDSIEGVKITGISKKGVTVTFNRQQYMLTTVSPLSKQKEDKKDSTKGGKK